MIRPLPPESQIRRKNPRKIFMLPHSSQEWQESRRQIKPRICRNNPLKILTKYFLLMLCCQQKKIIYKIQLSSLKSVRCIFYLPHQLRSRYIQGAGKSHWYIQYTVPARIPLFLGRTLPSTKREERLKEREVYLVCWHGERGDGDTSKEIQGQTDSILLFHKHVCYTIFTLTQQLDNNWQTDSDPWFMFPRQGYGVLTLKHPGKPIRGSSMEDGRMHPRFFSIFSSLSNLWTLLQIYYLDSLT